MDAEAQEVCEEQGMQEFVVNGKGAEQYGDLLSC